MAELGVSDGMAAQEQQLQRVVPVQRRFIGRMRGLWRQCDADLLPAAPRVIGTPDIDESAGRDRDQPCLRAVRHPLIGPGDGRREQRLLHRVLGRVEVPVPSRHRAEDPRRELTQQALDGRCGHPGQASTGGGPMIGRTSIGIPSGAPPTPGAADALAAIS